MRPSGHGLFCLCPSAIKKKNLHLKQTLGWTRYLWTPQSRIQYFLQDTQQHFYLVLYTSYLIWSLPSWAFLWLYHSSRLVAPWMTIIYNHYQTGDRSSPTTTTDRQIQASTIKKHFPTWSATTTTRTERIFLRFFSIRPGLHPLLSMPTWVKRRPPPPQQEEKIQTPIYSHYWQGESRIAMSAKTSSGKETKQKTCLRYFAPFFQGKRLRRQRPALRGRRRTR